jgi:U3-containing 90S pre-ribosomal complex subunit
MCSLRTVRGPENLTNSVRRNFLLFFAHSSHLLFSNGDFEVFGAILNSFSTLFRAHIKLRNTAMGDDLAALDFDFEGGPEDSSESPEESAKTATKKRTQDEIRGSAKPGKGAAKSERPAKRARGAAAEGVTSIACDTPRAQSIWFSKDVHNAVEECKEDLWPVLEPHKAGGAVQQEGGKKGGKTEEIADAAALAAGGFLRPQDFYSVAEKAVALPLRLAPTASSMESLLGALFPANSGPRKGGKRAKNGPGTWVQGLLSAVSPLASERRAEGVQESTGAAAAWGDRSDVGSPRVLIVCLSAVRCLALTKPLIAMGHRRIRVTKLFAKHTKLQDQQRDLRSNPSHIAVGTPKRIADLLENGALDTSRLLFLLFETSFVSPKNFNVLEQNETRRDAVSMLKEHLLARIAAQECKVVLL